MVLGYEWMSRMNVPFEDFPRMLVDEIRKKSHCCSVCSDHQVRK
jgi:hypothetical protein